MLRKVVQDGLIARKGSSRGVVTLAIRREDPSRVWERRAPLTPEDVAELKRKRPEVDVLVAPCHRRVFRGEEYVKAGARLTTDFRKADIIMGIKEIPLPELPLPASVFQLTSSHPSLLPSTDGPSPHINPAATHLMFSHTHKGQEYNTPLLSRFVAPTSSSSGVDAVYPRLIDYELLTNERGERTVGFGWFAGAAGVLESLSSLAHSHLSHGIASPFLYTPRPHSSGSFRKCIEQLKEIGRVIKEQGTPEPLGPVIIGVTGSGNVSKGMLDTLAHLPVQHITIEELDALVRNPDVDRRKIYVLHARPNTYFERIDGDPYSREDYYKHPDMYRSVFHDKIYPYLTLLLHGAGWAPGFPRLVTNAQLPSVLAQADALGGLRGRNVGDVSCDIGGALEFLTHSTTLSDPFYTVPNTPVQMMSVDILPTSLPLEASESFSERLMPYLHSLISSTSGKYKGKEYNPEKDGYGKALEEATVASGGKLKERHMWLQKNVDGFYAGLVNPCASTSTSVTSASTPASTPEAQASPSTTSTLSQATEVEAKKGDATPAKKRILMLGSGMVAKPAVDMIAATPGIELVIASNSLEELQTLTRGKEDSMRYRVADVSDPEAYVHLVEESDVVISLLPVAFHPKVGELCVKHGKHLVTASYISPQMKQLDEAAKAANVLLLNEIGLDPGIDHCSAIALLSQIRASPSSEVVSFTSFCGGLPAPDAAEVPLKYKFSWRPAGVLSAALNSARFKINGEMRVIPGESLLKSSFPRVPVSGATFGLEGLANRDSMVYCDTYGLDDGKMRTILRGTLRYPGFAQLMQAFKDLGLLEQSAKVTLNSWTDLLQQAMLVRHKDTALLHDLVPSQDLPVVLDALTWLGLLPSEGTAQRWPSGPHTPALPKDPQTPLDLFAHLLATKLRYNEGERDMVVLSHEIVSRNPSNPSLETVHTSTLISYGSSPSEVTKHLGGTAMARTVGIPVAIAALAVAEGKVASHVKGVVGPMDHSVYTGC
ncbi:hypothetical protein FA13DRAFT_1803049 [Coprinellus micaceus]|uniref:Alanine dehydrogenase/pyridine nucleotide transhydrogenase N-terminal domain-containing protein n=1 Tax=Coprinellus micaceus TaxID=71717 RepID=A0A4Y7SB46_COPMI|nr:hypothetical protein FA13DRAFT_1803049 [Coprinellus micaceus]